MLEQFWAYGIFAAILVFGVKVGLCLGFSGMRRRSVSLIFAAYFVALIGLSYILTPYTQEVYSFVYNYSSAIFAVIAIIIFVTGIKTVYDWKVTGSDIGSTTCMAVVAPCPCCFGAILSTVIIVAPLSGVSSITLGGLSAIALVAVMAISYLMSDKIVEIFKEPYPVILGNYLLFMGLYFLLCLMILPYIELLMSGTAITMEVTSYLPETVIALIVVLAVGILYGRRNSRIIV